MDDRVHIATDYGGFSAAAGGVGGRVETPLLYMFCVKIILFCRVGSRRSTLIRHVPCDRKGGGGSRDTAPAEVNENPRYKRMRRASLYILLYKRQQ